MKILFSKKFFEKCLSKRVLIFLFIFIFILSPFYTSQAQINKQINYQGKLTNNLGVAVPDGTYNMEFILYDHLTLGGAHILWTETRISTDKVQVTSGLFSVLLGEITPLTSVDFNQTLYLGVNIGGTGTPGWDGEMAPRKKLGAVPAAMVSEKALNIIGGNSTTLLGAIPYQSDINITTLLSPNTTTTKKFLRMTGDGTNGAIPAWDTVADGDMPSALTGKTYNGLTITANGTNTLNITAGKTLTVQDNVTITGALGTAAYTASTAYAAALGTDDNYVTDAEKTVIGNTSGVNTGDNATNSQYSGLAASKADVGQTMYIGTTSHAINRASAAEGLAGITSLTPGADFTLSQNSVNVFTSENTSAVVNTLYLKAGSVGINNTNPAVRLQVSGSAATDIIRTDMGLDLNPVAIPANPTASLIASSGNVNNGVHYYYVSYYTATGETQLSASITVTVTTDAGHGQVTVGIPVSSDPRVVGRKVYRTPADSNYFTNVKTGTNFTIAENTSTTFTDNFADTDLTSIDSNFRDNTTSKLITINGTNIMAASDKNTIFGYLAGAPIFAGTSTAGTNTFLGYKVGNAVTTASQNVGVGFQALNVLTSGIGNTALGGGSGALGRLTSGSYNVGIGWNAGYYNQTGTGNVNVGYNAGSGGSGSSNSNNVNIGHSAGYSNLTGNGSVKIGYQAGYWETAGNKLFIDNAQRTDEATGRTSALIYGVFDATPANQILSLGGGGKVGIGTTAPDKKLEINLGTTDALRLTYDDADGSAGTYMDTTLASDGGITFTGAGSSPDFTFAQDVLVPDEAYGIGWDSSLEIPTKNALYDKIQTLGAAGTVTTVSVTTANGVSGTVADATTTPAITLTLGAITPTTVNGLTITANGTNTLNITAGKTLTVQDNVTITGALGTAAYTASTAYAAALGTDDNYVTDAEKTVIGNTSGVNTGDNATNSQYSGLAASKADVGQTMYIGTTSHAINRASAAEGLAGITSLTPGADFTLSQNSVNVFTSENTSAVVNTLYLKAGSVGIGTTTPTNILSLGGTVARIIWMERNTTAATAGQGLTLFSGGAIAGTNNLAGGDLTLKSGISTGTGTSALHFFTAPAGSSGSTDNTPTEKMTILGNGNVGIGTTTPTTSFHLAGTTSSHFAQIDTGVNFKGVAEATSAPTATLLTEAGNITAGDHRYYVTFVTPLGETERGVISSTITADGTHGKVDLSNIPVSSDYRVTKRRIYRTIATSPLYHFKLLYEINDNTTTTYPDNSADGSLTGGSTYPGYYYQDDTTNSALMQDGTKFAYAGTFNTFFGKGAGAALVVPGNLNTFFGWNAGNKVTTASANTLIGESAGYSLVTGASNVFVGTYTGYGATGSNNIAIGRYAMYTGTSGTANTILGGGGIGLSVVIGSNNTYLGYLNGNANTGSNNVFVGYTAGRYETAGSKLIIDGLDRSTEAAQRTSALIYGVFDATPANQILSLGGGGKVGIANTSPGALLDVGLAGTTLGTIRLEGNTSGYVQLQSAAAAGSWTMTLPTGVAGTAGFQLTDAAGNGITSWTAAGSLREWKNNIQPFGNPESALTQILNTNVYTFNYKPGMGTGDSQTTYVGVMADETPWAMHYNGKIVNPVNTLGYMVLGIQALNEKITSLGQDINAFFSDAVQKVEGGVAYMKALVVNTLKIGSPEKRTGITFYDEVNGNPYCFSIANGTTKTMLGECAIITSPPTEESSDNLTYSPKDTNAPIITLDGDTLISLNIDSTYIEEGAIAKDDVDGEVAVIISGSVDTSTAGIYTITYTAKDTADNSATPVTRIVNVGEVQSQPEISQPSPETPAPTLETTTTPPSLDQSPTSEATPLLNQEENGDGNPIPTPNTPAP